MEHLKTSEQWCKAHNIDEVDIFDPDGWNRKDLPHSFREEKIDQGEFTRRLAASTVRFTPAIRAFFAITEYEPKK